MLEQPINNIQWMSVDGLKANDYNPNVVFNQELNLLKLSLLTNGWIQPILVHKDTNTIIDGFHRFSLGKNDPEVRNMTAGLVPCVLMDITEAERKMLTIRINRAKGSHIAIKMADIIKSLINEHGLSPKEVATGIGATKKEIDLLLMENVFKQKDIQNHEYSKAWYPK
jgi:ParB-like chromosome segregation protein Spo0J